MKWPRLIIQIVLLVVVVFLGWKLYSSIMEPIKYKKVKDAREQIIIKKMLNIKTLQLEYKNIHGRYTASFDTLKEFYLNGEMPVVLKKGTNDTLTELRALELGLITRDTSYVPIKDTLLKDVENFNIEIIDIVPFTNGKVKFDMKAGMVDRSRFKVPVMEVSCKMEDYLKDIPEQEILQNEIRIIEKENKDRADKKFPGLKLGSMEEPTLDGNWDSL